MARKAADVAAASLVWTWEEDGGFFIKWLKYKIERSAFSLISVFLAIPSLDFRMG